MYNNTTNHREVHFLLLIQDICLCWGKDERSSAYAKKRAGFPMVCTLDKLPNTINKDVIVHRLDFWQRGDTFQILKMNDVCRFQFHTSVQDLNLTNLSIQLNVESYEVAFFYDVNRSGWPVRRGHNKDYHNIDSLLYGHDILNETAFYLRQGQYGRVIWNERKVSYDTGEWYYQLHISNLLHYLGKMPESDVFLTSSLNVEYKQLAALY